MKRLLPFLLSFLCSAAFAESGSYRVEVIIFKNLNVITEARRSEELRSFSQFPSIEAPRPAMDTSLDRSSAPGSAAPPGLSYKPGTGSPGYRRSDLPDDLLVIEQKSTTMNEAWRRLRSSEDYQPFLYAAWEQNRTDYYPPIRIHDQQIIDIQLRPPTTIMVADLTSSDPLAAYRSTFYQFDGHVQLRRSRFLHVGMDLEYRQQQQAGIGTGSTAERGIPSEAEKSNAYSVYTMKQSRQISTGRLQYFDTPYLGALVLITAIEPALNPSTTTPETEDLSRP